MTSFLQLGVLLISQIQVNHYGTPFAQGVLHNVDGFKVGMGVAKHLEDSLFRVKPAFRADALLSERVNEYHVDMGGKVVNGYLNAGHGNSLAEVA